mmetsp:Transcript_2053/g.4968  ORF Transcript_2053/g.4968 Transcript_2053/m.4968 type:complete len:488 (+) Transcript_2053:6-1469(+)
MQRGRRACRPCRWRTVLRLNVSLHLALAVVLGPASVASRAHLHGKAGYPIRATRRLGLTASHRLSLRPVTCRVKARSSADEEFEQKFARREQFDLISFQSFRQEALLQYENTQQSGQLRIVIFLLAFLGSACAPYFLPSGAEYLAASALAALVSGALLFRERGERVKLLERLQREYALGDLCVDTFDPLNGVSRRRSVRELRKKYRVVVLYGTEAQLTEMLLAAVPYRRRFEQSAAVLVPVAALAADEGSAAVEAALQGPAGARAAGRWLSRAVSEAQWQAYFDGLLEDRGGAQGRSVWVALNFRGRVLGSDFGCPIWDELLAALPPGAPFRSTDPTYAVAEPADALEAQAAFYKALCGGDLATITELFVAEDDADLSAVIQVNADAATNLSSWDVVLAEGARPELVIASQDAVQQATDEAVTTCIEFPVVGPTLLATQVWRRMGDRGWRLLSHRTIPYAPTVEARVALRCDHRGCIAFGKQLDAMR